MAAGRIDRFSLEFGPSTFVTSKHNCLTYHANYFVLTHLMANAAERWCPSPFVAGQERGPLLVVKNLVHIMIRLNCSWVWLMCGNIVDARDGGKTRALKRNNISRRLEALASYETMLLHLETSWHFCKAG
jgi:hypothetical protein